MNEQRKKTQGHIALGAHAAGALIAGFALALTVILSPPVVPPVQHGVQQSAGGSVHAKNSETPDWILELETGTETARQLPVPIESDEPSFWI